MTAHRSGTTPGPAVVVMNPRSGGGKVTRFHLIERAERLGAQVTVTSEELGAAALARLAVEQGAQVLGVAGGDGTVAAVAAVAAEADCPLVVVPAGTRNHFARDLGLDTRNPARALTALVDPEPVRVDLGSVGSRVFVNNVSFGVYADALLEPGYRQAKARSFAAVAPPYLEGQRWVDAGIDTPVETIADPQVVLVSNNPYHLSTLRELGRRFSLSTGRLGAIVIKRPATPPPPDLLPRLRQDLRRHASTGSRGAGVVTSPGTGVVTWSAMQVELTGSGAYLTAGIDGEAVTLQLPITCRIRPAALRILLPRERPGVPEEPAPDRRHLPGKGHPRGVRP